MQSWFLLPSRCQFVFLCSGSCAISRGRFRVLVILRKGGGQEDGETGAFADNALHLDMTAMFLQGHLGEIQTDARSCDSAGCRGTVVFVENLVQLGLWYANALIMHLDCKVAFVPAADDMDIGSLRENI